MARKIVTREETDKVRVYGSIRILKDNRVRFSPMTGAVPSLTFLVLNYHGEGEGDSEIWVYDSESYSIHACRGGETLLMLSVDDNRINSACFNFTLDPKTLREAVADLRKTGGGIERWLTPALEWTHFSLTQGGRNPEARKIIPGLLRSLQGIPRPIPPYPVLVERKMTAESLLKRSRRSTRRS